MRRRTQECEECYCLRDFFFHIYGKNLKLSTKSTLMDPTSFIRDLCDYFDFDRITPDAMIVDLGVEWHPHENADDGLGEDVDCAPRTLLWRAAFLDRLFQQIKATAQSLRFPWNHCSSIGSKSAEWPPGVRKILHCAFMQAYHLEKALLFNFGRGESVGAFRFDVDDAWEYNSRYIHSIETMKYAWLNSADVSFGARLETRISFAAFPHVIDIVHQRARSFVVNGAFAAVPTHLISHLKLIKLSVYNEVLHRIFLCPLEQRSDVKCLALVQLLFWLISTISSRQQEIGQTLSQPQVKEVLTAIDQFNMASIASFNSESLIVDRDDEYGLIDRIRGFRRAKKLRKKLLCTKPKRSRVRAKRQVKKGKEISQNHESNEISPQTNNGTIAKEHPDETPAEDRENHNPIQPQDLIRLDHSTLNRVAERLFQNFKLELWAALPNPGRHLKDLAYQHVEYVDFTQQEMSYYLRNPHFSYTTRVKVEGKIMGSNSGRNWRQRFDLYFNTTRELRGAYKQGWDHLLYLKEYRQCCGAMTPAEIHVFNKILLEKFMQLETLPCSTNGKVWSTGAKPKETRTPEDQENTRFVFIILNENLIKD
ncbi:uncharacterized protein VTP21DRAFT_4074 [Calcarisporiella thermophila]|uniref:uncharacterized protein n=1 Tax=Calcarisporiella thermophila TaxID=911321 RepID=UPI0037421B05